MPTIVAASLLLQAAADVGPRVTDGTLSLPQMFAVHNHTWNAGTSRASRQESKQTARLQDLVLWPSIVLRY